MRKITKTECYLEIIKMAGHDIDNERMLRVVTSLAYHTAEYCGPDVILLLNNIKMVTDDRGNVDRYDPVMWKSICQTAGEIVARIWKKEDAERKRQRRTCNAAYMNINGRAGTYYGQ